MPFNELLLFNTVTLSIAALQEDYKLVDELILAGIPNPANIPASIVLLVGSSVKCGGIEGPSIDCTGIHPNSRLVLVNDGSLYGYGGRGGPAEGRVTNRQESAGNPFAHVVAAFGAPGGQGQGYSNAPKAGASATTPALGTVPQQTEPVGNTGNEAGPGLGRAAITSANGGISPALAFDVTDRESYSLDGGDALSLGCPTFIINNGEIFAGGGGGQGGSYWHVPFPYNGSWYLLFIAGTPLPLAPANGVSANGGAWGTDGDSAPLGTITGQPVAGSSGYAVRQNGFELTWLAGNNPAQVKGTVG